MWWTVLVAAAFAKLSSGAHSVVGFGLGGVGSLGIASDSQGMVVSPLVGRASSLGRKSGVGLPFASALLTGVIAAFW